MRFVLAALAGLALAAPAFGQDGTKVSGGDVASGAWHVVEYLLCDGDHTTVPADCAEIDLHRGPTGAASWPGMPHHMTVSLRSDACTGTANDLQIQLNSRSGITAAAGLATSVGAHVPGVLSWDGGTSGVTMLPVDQLTHRYVRGELLVAGTGGACNDLEVVLIMFYPRPTH